MFKTNSHTYFQRLLFAYLLILASILFSPFNGKLLAEQETLPAYTLKFTPPNKGQSSGNGTEKPRRTAARSLGNLQAIVPWTETDPVLQRPIHRGHTATSHPVFWLSYDSKSERGKPIEIYLEIRDINTNGQIYFYQNDFSVIRDSESNTLPIQLPKDAPPLLSGTEYQWKFIASKNGKLIGETVGYIERLNISPEATSQLSNADLITKAEIYARQGIWHELLDTVAQLKQNNPRDSRFQNAWKNLLQQ
jgi:hypothetical protein